MYDACEMEMLDAAEHLVEQVAHALVVQVHLDNLAQIGVHQLHHQVYILELLEAALRRERVQQADDLRTEPIVLLPYNKITHALK